MARVTVIDAAVSPTTTRSGRRGVVHSLAQVIPSPGRGATRKRRHMVVVIVATERVAIALEFEAGLDLSARRELPRQTGTARVDAERVVEVLGAQGHGTGHRRRQ